MAGAPSGRLLKNLSGDPLGSDGSHYCRARACGRYHRETVVERYETDHLQRLHPRTLQSG
jgi:hypothetical protein